MMIKECILFLIFCFTSTIIYSQAGHDTKLIFGYTARPLQVGQGYIHTVDGLVYEAEVGVTPFLSVGVGTMLSAFTGGKGILRGGGLKAKLAFPIGENKYWGIGTVVLRDFGEEFSEAETSNITTGMLTVDFEKTQVNIGVGFATRFWLADEASNLKPLMTLGAIFPIFKDGYLVNENWGIFFDNVYTDRGYAFLSSLVVRWNANPFSFELGVSGVLAEDGDGGFNYVLPQVGVSYHFFKEKK